MTLPTDAIVVTCYSGAVNLASVNSQSLASNSPPVLPQQQQVNQNIASRISRHLDNVFRIPGLAEVVAISEKLTAYRVHGVIALTETTAITEALIRRAKPRISTEAVVSKGAVSITNGLGVGNYVQLNSRASFTNQLSIVAWVKFINTDNSGYGGIISFINGYAANRLLLNSDAQTILFETSTSVNGVVDCSYTIPNAVYSNAWHHFAAVYNGTSGTMQLYLDGAAVGSPVSQSGALLSGSGLPLIGSGTSGSYYMHGNVAELALYNTALTAGQVSNVYNNGANTVASGRVSYYKFNEGSGLTVRDSAGTINGILVNDPQWSTDLHIPVPNPSIYNGYVSEKITKKLVRKLVEGAISIAESLRRLPRPFLRENIFITDAARRAFTILISNIVSISEGSGFTSGFTNPFNNILAITRKFIPPMIQTTTISETLLRRVRPKVTLQTIAIAELLAYVKGHFITLTETISIIESKLRKVIPKFAIQTTTIADSQLRKPAPKIITQVSSISESLLRKTLPKIVTEVRSISEALLRKPIPKIIQTTVISEALTRFKGRGIALTETILIVEARLRRIIPKIATQSIAISESQLRKIKPTIAVQSTSISDSRARKFMPRTISDIVSIAEAISRFAKRVRSAADTITISESKARKLIPSIASQSTSISESIKRKLSRFLTETNALSGLISRKLKFSISETKAISDSVNRLRIRLVALSEVSAISETKRRKVIPKILTQSSVISDAVSNFRGRILSIVQTVAITEAINRRLKRLLIQTTSISELSVRRIIPKIALQTTTISETQTRRIFRIIAQTISVLESLVRKYVRRIASTDTVTISDAVGKTSAVASIKTVVYNIAAGSTTSTFPSGQGFAGQGETKNRPWPVRDYIRDYLMVYRKRWKPTG